jgi:hypothetical protein
MKKLYTKNNIFTGTALLIICLFISTTIFATEIDENLLFSDENTTVDSSQVLSDSLTEEFEKESVTFSGSIMSRGMYLMHRNWLNSKSNIGQNQLLYFNEADFFLDIRLKKQTKAFINFSIISNTRETSSSSNILDNAIKEFFIDTNINKAVYIRAGKQVLQWGRTYFWNPTDFINIEKPDFFDMGRYRQGVYGTKVHIPFGTSKNIYLFCNTQSADNLDQLAFAGKYEFLLNNSELAFSAWKKIGSGPAYGFDFSTNLFNIDVSGEASLIYERGRERITVDNNSASLKSTLNRWRSQASISFMKTFNWELSDRISLIGEFFYNEKGYNENIFNLPAAKDLLLNNNLYEANYYGKYYGALFASINKFPLTDTTLNFNAISNISDTSYVFITGLNYEPVDHFTISTNLNWFGGPPAAEYTYLGYGLAADIFTTIIF